MNYRHHFHAGNFADVWKHVLLVQLLRGMQQKEKGFLFLDTHAGRGGYDLELEGRGDTLARRPEFPDGVGRLWAAEGLPQPLADYLSLVRGYNRTVTDREDLRMYPGSPRLAQLLARPQDRLALCELHPEEFQALQWEFRRERRVSVQMLDGYAAMRAMLPPPEKRALVLVDPPFEDPGEFSRMADALGDGLRRLPAGTFALWYPLTERARVEAFYDELLPLDLPPTLVAEVAIAGPTSERKMKGCGLLVLNPPWQIERLLATFVPQLAERLAQEPGGGASLRWLVPE